MKRLTLNQNTPKWHEHRAKHRNASEAPVIFGVSPYATRAEFIKMNATGDTKAITRFQQMLFDRGHAVEAISRPIVEKLIGKTLYPPVIVDDNDDLSASMDGLTANLITGWECKSMNAGKRKFVDHGHVPDCDAPQLAQAFKINGKMQEILYTLSDGTKENTVTIVVKREHLQHLIDKMDATWDQYDHDLKNYDLSQPIEGEVVGKTLTELPYLAVRAEGKVLASNIDEYKSYAIDFFNGISTDLQTDQDYADAAEAVKFCQSVEDRLVAVKQDVLAQTADIDSLFCAIDEIAETARRKRLEVDKLAKARKEAQRAEIVESRVQRLRDHIKALAPMDRVSPSAYVPERYNPQQDIAEAMKGKKLVSALKAAADQVVADHMIQINTRYQVAVENHGIALELVTDHDFLFKDLTPYVSLPKDAVAAMIKQEIAEYDHVQEKKREAEEALANAGPEPKADVPAKAEPVDESNETPCSDPDKGTESRVLSDYEMGYIDGMTAYAWWKDGVEMVGTCGKTLESAIGKFLNRQTRGE